ncbi:MAG TPA: hypothetical protein VK612_09105 [Pyrinomonadaceae bacterium]|nr:hypothetical protein [Pyrinomonadaceae bacterium]
MEKNKTAIEKSDLETTKVTITLPKGCTRTALSINALDSTTRDLAYQTLITVNNKILPCTAFSIKNGNLILEILPDFFKLIEVD